MVFVCNIQYKGQTQLKNEDEWKNDVKLPHEDKLKQVAGLQNKDEHNREIPQK